MLKAGSTVVSSEYVKSLCNYALMYEDEGGLHVFVQMKSYTCPSDMRSDLGSDLLVLESICGPAVRVMQRFKKSTSYVEMGLVPIPLDQKNALMLRDYIINDEVEKIPKYLYVKYYDAISDMYETFHGKSFNVIG